MREYIARLWKWVDKRIWNRDQISVWQAYIETLIVLVLILVINFLFFRQNPGFIDTSPHPFWIAILLIALRYKTRDALTCIGALTAVFCYFVFTDSRQTFYFSTLTLLKDFKTPVLFFLIGSILSESTNRLVELTLRLRERIKNQIKANKALKQRENASKQALVLLEQKISNQYSNILNLFELLFITKQMDTDEIKNNILDVLIDVLHAKHCTFYDVKGAAITVFKQKNSNETKSTVVDPLQDVILMNSLREKNISHLSDKIPEEDYTQLKGTSVIAAPIISLDGKVLGLVSIEELPFIEFTENFIALFRTILRWWGRILEEKQLLEIMKSKNVFNEEMGCYRYQYFSRRFEQEFKRSKEFAIPICISLIRVKDYSKIEPKRRWITSHFISTVISEMILELEMVFEGKDDGSFYIIFPVQLEKDVSGKLESISKKIKESELKPYLDPSLPLEIEWSVADFKMDQKSHVDMIDLLEKKFTNERT